MTEPKNKPADKPAINPPPPEKQPDDKIDFRVALPIVNEPDPLDAYRVESHFVVPFLPSTDDSEGHGLTCRANPELLEKYLAHLRTLIDAKTVEALQAGADVGVKLSFQLEFE